MVKQTKQDTLKNVNKEIRRLARLINDRVYRKELEIDETGLYTQAIARVAAQAETTAKNYNPQKPRLPSARLPTLGQAMRRLEQYQMLENKTRTLTTKGVAQWYEKRITEVNRRTGLAFSRKYYNMLLRLQHTAGNDVWASSQLVDFFGTLAAIPKSIKDKISIDLSNYDSIVKFLQSTSFPMDELRELIDEFANKKTVFKNETYVSVLRTKYNNKWGVL